MIKDIIKKLIELTKEKEIVPITHSVDSKQLLSNKVALISGGTGGIGVAIARSLIESGCKVILAGTSEEKLYKIKTSFNSELIETIILNYSKSEDLMNKIESASKIFGKIDIFVSSAGVHTEKVDFWSMTPDEYDRVLSINLKGTFFACQAVAEYMKNNNIKGHVLLVSSSRGSEPAWSPYGISKWGMNGLTKGLAQMLLPYGIVVNAIAPGSTATSLIGVKENDSIYTSENRVGRYIMPDEVASLAKLLVSDEGNMIIGETVHISGGRGTFDIR